MEKQIKTLSYKVADIDGRKRMVKFYYAGWDSVDLDGDIIRKGATLKSANERGPKGKGLIRHFVNHEFKTNPGALPIGKLLDMGEDNTGAWAWTKMARTATGNDIYSLYEDGFINNHSFGFIPVPGKYKDTISGKEIFEVKIFEVSTVTTLSANIDTPTIDVKQQNKAVRDDTLNKYESLLLKPSRYTSKEIADLETIYKLLKI